MLTIILISICVPVLAGAAHLALRERRPQLQADARGIALQTVIVIVVLLAIAGAVAGVLITRGEAEVARFQDQSTTGPARYNAEQTCKNGGYGWDASHSAGQKCFQTVTNKAACDALGGTLISGTTTECYY